MRPSSKIFMALSGILYIAVGVIVIANQAQAVNAVSWLLGVLILIAGVSTLMAWLFSGHMLLGGGTILFASIGEILVGLLFLYNVPTLSAIIPYIFAIWILIKGVDVAIHSFDYKQVGFSYWWALLILGIASAVLGFFSLTKEGVGSASFAIILGIAIILQGLQYIIALFGIGKLEHKVKKFLELGD